MPKILKEGTRKRDWCLDVKFGCAECGTVFQLSEDDTYIGAVAAALRVFMCGMKSGEFWLIDGNVRTPCPTCGTMCEERGPLKVKPSTYVTEDA